MNPLVVALVISFWQFPNMPPVRFAMFETEAQCISAAHALDKSTKVIFNWSCREVRT